MARGVGSVLGLLCLSGGTAHASVDRDLSARDGIFTIAPAVPRIGAVRVSARGELASSAPNPATLGAGASVSVSRLGSVGARIAAEVGSTWEDSALTPSVAARWQLLSQRDMPLDLSVIARFRSAGLERTGSEVDARVSVGRSVGRWALAANVLVGKGIEGRGDLDFEAASGLSAGLGRLRLGVEARARTELVDDLKTDEDLGRPVELLVGPAVSLLLQWFQLQALVGWSSPRGLNAPGALARAVASIDF